MNRGGRTLAFVLLATLANALVTLLVFVLLLLLYGLTLGRVLELRSSAPVVLAAFAFAVVASSLIYKKGLDWARKRWNLNELLGFGPGKR